MCVAHAINGSCEGSHMVHRNCGNHVDKRMARGGARRRRHEQWPVDLPHERVQGIDLRERLRDCATAAAAAAAMHVPNGYGRKVRVQEKICIPSPELAAGGRRVGAAAVGGCNDRVRNVLLPHVRDASAGGCVAA